MNDLLSEFGRRKLLLEAFTECLGRVITELLEQEGLRPHSVTRRLKTEESLSRKLAKPDALYEALADVTDLCGIRIITYFSHDVDVVAAVLERELAIDWPNSIDKRQALDPDRFGYSSLHYVASLSEPRVALTEYSRFNGLKAEIQIRSILQHAWAEIEHDLGYKSINAVPRSTRRQFSRLAGLLELADVEFERIREGIEKYTQSLASDISYPEKSVLVDKVTLTHFVQNDSQLRALDLEISSAVDIKMEYAQHFVDSLVDKLMFVKLRFVSDLSRALANSRDALLSFVVLYLKKRNYGRLFRGTALFYLCSFVLAREDGKERLYDYLDHFGIAEEQSRVKLAAGILSRYKQSVSRGDLTKDQADGVITAVKSGYGFISPDDGGAGIFFHWSEVTDVKFSELQTGDRVRYVLGRNEKGLCANQVRLQGAENAEPQA